MFAGVAIALLVLRGGISGNVTSGNFNLILSPTAGDISTDGGCTAVRSGPTVPGPTNVAGTIAFTWTGTLPGDICTLTAKYTDDATPNTENAYLQAISLPAGLTGDLGASCGLAVPVATVATPVSVAITFTGTVANPVFDSGLHGFEFVRQSEFSAGLC